MSTPTSQAADAPGSLPDQRHFSVVIGGPLFQLLRRAHLSDDALRLLRQRVIAIALIAWLPLLLLSALEGHVLDGGVALPFLLDAKFTCAFWSRCRC